MPDVQADETDPWALEAGVLCRRAMEAGNLAEAQVWATLHLAETLDHFVARLLDNIDPIHVAVELEEPVKVAITTDD